MTTLPESRWLPTVPRPEADRVAADPRHRAWRATFEFFRPVILAAVICVAVFTICLWQIRRSAGLDSLPMADALALRVPTPSLSPRDVVAIQIEGLRRTSDPILGMLQCYCFAAPANRLATGPFQRFYSMVRRAPYDRLIESVTYRIGREHSLGNQARILATVTSPDRKLQVYAFILEKQSAPPFVDCWMTLGVFALLPPDAPRGSAGPQKGPEADREI